MISITIFDDSGIAVWYHGWEVFICQYSKWKDFITAWDAEQRIAWSLKIFIVSVIQIVTFHMNSTLANVILGCTICIFDVSATYLTGKNRIRIKRNTHLVSMLIVIWPYGSSYCKLLLCYENLSILMWTKYKESVKEFQSK